MGETIPITVIGFANLKQELHRLLTVERPSVKRAIAEAREHGDLRENAEYHAARERQSFIEGRIQQIQAKLPVLRVVNPVEVASEKVAFGAQVTLEDQEEGTTFTYQIVGPDEADLKQQRISFRTPVAQALIGKRVGDIITIHVPRGRMEVEITQLRYE